MEAPATFSNPCPDNLPGVMGQLFLTLINTLMVAKCPLGAPDLYPADYASKLTEDQQFDFIVIGGGSAGSVVANRLSENGNWNVLVLEAGGYPSAISDTPSLLFSLQNTHEDWNYEGEVSSTSCLGTRNKRCKYPRGRVLGGCSSINAMIYVRGNKKDYDDWAEMGNNGWDWDSVEPHFREVENLQSEHLDQTILYGRQGYQTLTWYDSGEPIAATIKESARGMGYPTPLHEDPLNPLGFYETLSSIEKGTRLNSAKAFLGKARDRKNLHVAVNAKVTKILIEETSKAAIGVEVNINGKALRILCKKEVILSGGSVNSPQVLMLSGIGPRTHLESLGIKVTSDLPVGENLQDHPMVHGIYFKLDPNAARPIPPNVLLDELYSYFMYRVGGLSQISTTNLVGFVNTKNSSRYPNIQYLNAIYNNEYLLPAVMRSLGFADRTTRSFLEAQLQGMTASLFPVLLNPKSRGRILLKSKDASEQPLIYPEYFTDEDGEDIETTLEGIRLAEKLLESPSFSKHSPELIRIEVEGCDGFEFRSDDYWKCLVRHIGATNYHPAGTCKMGPDGDESAVVDGRLRVRGVKNLRVVDASIMPKIVSGNTNGPTMMIGHKGGKMIIEDYSARHEEL